MMALLTFGDPKFKPGADAFAPLSGGGVPSWVRRAANGDIALSDADVANGRYWADGRIFASRHDWQAATLAAVLAYGYQAGTVIIDYTTPATGGSTLNLWMLSDGTAANRIALRRSSSRVGQLTVTTAGVAQADIFAGPQPDSTAVRCGCGWAVNDFIQVTNGGGGIDVAGNVPTGLTALDRMAGYEAAFTRETVFARKLQNDEIVSFTEPDSGIIVWGDSITAGVTGTANAPPARLAALTGRYVYNGGVGGETSTQILARFMLRPQRWNKSTIIEMGRNNVSDANQVTSDIAAAIGKLGHSRYLVVSILPSAADNPSQIAAIAQLNADLSALYGSRFIDILTPLQAANDGSANDLADVAAGYIPRSLRAPSDPLHPNTAGNQVIANTYSIGVTANGL